MNTETIAHVLDFSNWNADRDDMEPRFGLYALLDDDVNVVYVGHSSNIPLRIAQHTHEGAKQFSSVIVYNTLPGLSSENFRLQLEGILILYFLPKYNKGINLGFSKGKVWEIRWNSRKSSAKSSGRRAKRAGT